MAEHTQQLHIPYHIPALLPEAIDALRIRPDGIYADATFGGGGHSRAIIALLGDKGHLYGFDRDKDALRNAIDDERFTFVRSNFMYMSNFMRYYGVESLDGILADLGVSFHHFDDAGRGFSFREDAPLDMRMNREGGERAADILNNADEETLTQIFRVGSDIPSPAKVARAIINARNAAPLTTTFQLADAVSKCVNPKSEKKDLAQIFQAIRIRVNHELDALEGFLTGCARLLRPGGRLAVITYHSLEDRLVKAVMRSGNINNTQEKDFFGNISTPWKIITRSPIVPSAEEIERNPRSRSAKLRVAELK